MTEETKSKQEIIDELKSLGVDFDETSPKIELIDLLDKKQPAITEDLEPTKEQVDEDLSKEDNTTIESESVDGEKVIVDKIQLDNIMERLNTLEGKKIKRSVALENKTCRIRLIDGKIVVGYGKSWEKIEVGGRKVLVLEVITEDDVKHKVDFVEFNENGDQLVCEILETKKNENVEELGFVYAKKVDYDNYRTYETDTKVPLLNKSVTIDYKLRLPDGKEIWMKEDAIN